jgi:very-short-patch-repair endonuclease
MATKTLGTAEMAFLRLWLEKAPDFPVPVTQYLFAKAAMGRLWLADFCWIDERLIVEIQGGTWNGGGHVTGGGYQKDCERMNAAQELGYRILYYTPQMVKREPNEVVAQVKRFINLQVCLP